MCFHTKETLSHTEIQRRFKAKLLLEEYYKQMKHYNGFTHPKTPVITNDKKEYIDHLQWGLIPFWAKDDEIKKFTLNARIETIKEKPSFRQSVKNRCLVLVNGFYEWQWKDPKGKEKQRYDIGLEGEKGFALGGIWSEWTNKETGEIIKSYSIVTTKAKGIMEEIHNSKLRMPIMLTEEEEEAWLENEPMEQLGDQLYKELVAHEA